MVPCPVRQGWSVQEMELFPTTALPETHFHRSKEQSQMIALPLTAQGATSSVSNINLEQL